MTTERDKRQLLRKVTRRLAQQELAPDLGPAGRRHLLIFNEEQNAVDAAVAGFEKTLPHVGQTVFVLECFAKTVSVTREPLDDVIVGI